MDTLSLEKTKICYCLFFFSSPPRFLFLCFYSFLFTFLSFPFLISFSHHFFFSFLFLLLFHFSPFSPFSMHSSPPFRSIDRMGQKEEVSSPPSSSQMCGYPISIHFLLFHNSPFITSSLTWLNVSHGIHATHVAQCESFLFMPSVTLFEVPCGIPLPCHVSSDTPRLEKREIPTTSESNEIRRGS